MHHRWALGSPIHQIRTSLVVSAGIEQVFKFFCDPANLGELTPPSMAFKILSVSTPAIQQGTEIEYRIRLDGIPMKWRTLIEVWEPPNRFIDLQIVGPYCLWRHQHTFREVQRGVEIGDCVDYQLPLGPLGEIIHTLTVKRRVESIFSYRTERIRQMFGSPNPTSG